MIRDRRLAMAAAAVLCFILVSCAPPGEMREETSSVPLPEAERSRIDINMSSGKMFVGAGTDQLMEAVFRFNVDRWEPTIDSSVHDGQARLSIRQGKSSRIHIGRTKNEWDVRLNGSLPLDLGVDLGAGECRLDLRELDVESLKVDIGAGDLNLDLSGKIARDIRVEIDGGVGHATLILPEGEGVRVHIDGGLGSVSAPGFDKTGSVYTNSLYGRAERSVRVEIDGGVGSIDLRLD